ncbi:hypothetical protein DFH08DRAFT_933883 [Mycena albidolilacea]|uniref:Transmembrane protein n=1 Tax=Mycena albidolilacea TaxID=1033008 RepID=A0AAD7EWV6_9AGAR|nr:hypothetical protein DFH08DRAFT_933883 [Mycena albidolilacea]
MSPFPSAIVLCVVALSMHSARAQDGKASDIEDKGQNSKIAITGVVIGGILFIIALLALAVYGIDRCMSRRRAKKGPKFTPLPTTSREDEPYRYLMPLKNSRHGPFYPGDPPASPNSRTTVSQPSSPAYSFRAQSVRSFDPYAHGPYYPGPTDSTMPRVATPLRPSFPSSQATLVFEPLPENYRGAPTPVSPSFLHDQRPGTISRTTTNTLDSVSTLR